VRTRAILAALGAALLSAQAGADPDAEIARLLDFVATSDCRMVRNGKLYAAPEARAHLERKLAWLRDRDRVSSAEDFIERVASRSSLSGRAYAVRCQGRPEQPSGDWLRHELDRLRRARSGSPDAG
jgi:hypothetical protein